MSWQDRLEGDMTITTGDGKVYVPQWIVATKAKEFNTSSFDFNEIDGSLVPRKRPRGKVYNIEIFFQGDDHLDISDAFDESSNDPRPWGISHPVYGGIIVQPSSLQWDNSVMNRTRITGTLLETISDENIKITVSGPDKIAENKVSTDAANAASFAADIPAKKVSVLQQVKGNVDSMYKLISKKIAETTDTSAFTNKYNEVLGIISTTVYDANALIGSVQQLMSMPAQFVADVKNRIAMYEAMFTTLNSTAANITTKDGKVVFESFGSVVVSSLVLATVTNMGTAYTTKAGVLTVIGTVHTVWTTFIDTLNGLQTDNGGEPDSFTPDPGTIIRLGELVGYVISVLFEIAKDSRQERVTYTETETNVILLVYKYYGVVNEKLIDEFKEQNNIGLSEILIIPKGRRIVYYV